MSSTFDRILDLALKGEVLISEHGYDELADDGISLSDVMESITKAIVVEDYPTYPKGACVLVLQKDRDAQPIHVVWGIPKGFSTPAVLVTAYRPDPEFWSADFLRRKE